MKKIFQTTLFIAILILLVSWGSTGHRIINQHAPASFPYLLNFLETSWTTILAEHASDADYRKEEDPTESPKHYIDIENYNEFQNYGRIPMSYDSAVMLHGSYFVIDNGTLPWSTVIAFDTLKRCFQRRDFTKASLVAADLGHYVADGHQPMHITRNYDGQTTGNDGIHSRYETSMINRYDDQISFTEDSAFLIPDVASYVFTYIYENHRYVDSVLIADDHATQVAGSTSGTTYYNDLWDQTSTFTVGLFNRASYALSSLIYTAWVNAGSPLPYPAGIEEQSGSLTRITGNSPNPFSGATQIALEVVKNNTALTVTIADGAGKTMARVADGKWAAGHYNLRWDAGNLPGGLYFAVLKCDGFTQVVKMVVLE